MSGVLGLEPESHRCVLWGVLRVAFRRIGMRPCQTIAVAVRRFVPWSVAVDAAFACAPFAVAVEGVVASVAVHGSMPVAPAPAPVAAAAAAPCWRGARTSANVYEIANAGIVVVADADGVVVVGVGTAAAASYDASAAAVRLDSSERSDRLALGSGADRPNDASAVRV